MGPRRKISVAVAEYKQSQTEEVEAALKREEKRNSIAANDKVEDEDSVRDEVPSFKGSGKRPPLRKQSSTEVTTAYRNVRVQFL